ncbi:hypothetical protein ACHAXA_005316 [Cyclostephanos tholiformis]|uniref:Uncharacterized protein n=1 Tax=Cyclostephanos tholiformis TaxID=382380 RepID=A0ABD3REG4_9STRA
MRPHNIIAILSILSSVTVDAQSSATNATEIPDVSPCPVCPDGLTVSGSSVIQRPEAPDGMTCDGLIEIAGAGVTQDICDEMLLAEEYCCPPAAATPCDVCADGITVDSSTSVGQGSSKTCGDLLIDSGVVEEGSEVCALMKNAEPRCCPSSNTTSPTIAPIENVTLSPTVEFQSCPVCPDGITVANETSIGGNGKTCGSLLVDAMTEPSDSVGCQLMQEEQLACCPSKATDPCPVCPDGITVESSTAVGSAGKTCADLLIDRENTEESSDTCTGMFEVAGPVCCPEVPTTSPSSSSGGNVTESDVGDEDATVSPTASPTDDSTETNVVDTPSPSSAPFLVANITYGPTTVVDVAIEDTPSPTMAFLPEPAAPATSESTRRTVFAIAATAISAMCAVSFVV